MKIQTDIGKRIPNRNFTLNGRFFGVIIRLAFFMLVFSFYSSELKAQDMYIDEKESNSFLYDEIPVLLVIEGVGNFNVDVIYTNTDLLYVNIEDLFRILKIQCVAGKKGDSLGGFIENESRPYQIDFAKRQIVVNSRKINTTNALVKENGSLYLESSYFADAFGILLTFNYRSLTLLLKSDFELPVIKQIRIEKLRNNLSKVKMEEKPDTLVSRNYHFLKLGTFDWDITTVQKWNESVDNRFTVGLGTEFLFGEADLSLTYFKEQDFSNHELQYLWRWVDNNKPYIRQAQVGKIATQSISFINSAVVGAVVRNSPTTIRKATGYYTISEYTEPNWTVELYINNIMVDYTKADASGLFVFKVPVVYGYNTLKLKFYGPLGEERTDERTMNVPYTVMPAKEFEYGITGGIVQDSSHSHFGRGEFSYGINNKITVGGGLEYLSSIPNSPFIPFAKATIQPFSKLTINGEYAHGVKTSGLLNYYFSRDIQLEIDYTKYVEGQMAARFNAQVERKAKLAIPFRYKKLNGYTKLEYSQFGYSEFNYNQSSVLLSATYNQFSVNSSLQLNWIGRMDTYITSDFAMSYRLGHGILIQPSMRVNISEGEVVTYKAEVAKRIPKGYFSASYERNLLFNDHFVNVSFKYDLPFAKTNFSVSQSKKKVSTSASAQGSLAFDGKNDVWVNNTSSIGKGGILLYPFLDLNQNGVFDQNEHMVKVTKLRINGGRTNIDGTDSVVRISDLNAFTTYNISFNDNDLDNITWKFRNKVYQVLVDPNQFKRVDVPVVTFGEMSGMVYKEKNSSLKGIGRILIKIYNKGSSVQVAETLSESDGYVYYLGLEPGEYVACVDSVQLRNLDLSVDPPCRNFTVKPDENGDVLDGIDFILHPIENDFIKGLPQPKSNPVNPVVDDDKSRLNVQQAETDEEEKIDLQ